MLVHQIGKQFLLLGQLRRQWLKFTSRLLHLLSHVLLVIPDVRIDENMAGPVDCVEMRTVKRLSDTCSRVESDRQISRECCNRHTLPFRACYSDFLADRASRANADEAPGDAFASLGESDGGHVAGEDLDLTIAVMHLHTAGLCFFIFYKSMTYVHIRLR